MLRGRELSVATRQPPYYLPRVQSRQVQKGETLPYINKARYEKQNFYFEKAQNAAY